MEIRRLEQWVVRNGWAGYDPYDVKGTRMYIRLLRHSYGYAPALPSLTDFLKPMCDRLTRGGWRLRQVARLFDIVLDRAAGACWRHLVRCENRHPRLVRRILFIRRKVNAKGIGLFAKAYLTLYESSGRKEHAFLERALWCLDWLENNTSPGYSGMCWGYPFDWQSRVVFFPRNTPSAVVSTVVGNAFLMAHEVLGDSRYLDVAESICSFISDDLNVDEINDKTLCFSYTPLDNMHIHNANLMAAEFLIRVGKKTQDERFVDRGMRAANYALMEQNEDGSLYYFGRIDDHLDPKRIDHYHSGFEMRALYGIWQSTGSERFFDALERYYDFYLKNLVISDGEGIAPRKWCKGDANPVDIHVCAEGILLNSVLARTFERASEVARGLHAWVVPRMQTTEGWFIYMIERIDGRDVRVEIPYIRWGQAWMMLALAEYTMLDAKESK